MATRAEEIAREHARLALLNLELVLEDEQALDQLAGRVAAAASGVIVPARFQGGRR